MFKQFFETKANVDIDNSTQLDRMATEINEIRGHVANMSQHSMSTT